MHCGLGSEAGFFLPFERPTLKHCERWGFPGPGRYTFRVPDHTLALEER